MKSASTLLILTLISSLSAFAQQRVCSQGQGSDRLELPGGYVAQVAPAGDDAHAGECHASITTDTAKTVFELFEREIAINPISGKDVNADGVPDAVIETHPAAGKCCWNYYVFSLGQSPGLLRQFSTSVALNFEDKLGDGKVEIWTRDFAFDGVDNFPHAESPAPLIFFRMHGTTVNNVSQLFWQDYEREINETRSYISRDDIDTLTKVEGDNPKPPEEGDPKEAHLRSVRAQILALVLDYIYADHTPDAFKTISDMWPVLDRQRLRQLILQRRGRGILSEINRIPKTSAAVTVGAAPPATTPANANQ
ncbi:MAG TPA: hypothetical protein VGR50_08730 [Terriglobales bacterium]|nr:hypothetical protein [Terriglobales bacterium]